jgi:DNA replication protein DnaC
MTLPSDRNEPQEHTAEEKAKGLAHALGKDQEGHGFKKLADALPVHLRSLLERGITDEELCPRCKIYSHPGHECCTCLDGGRISEGEGMIALCPDCSGVRPSGPEPLTEEEFAASARIPLKFAETTVDAWKLDEYRTRGGSMGDPKGQLLRYGRTWPPKKPFLSLLGTPGLGKTHLAVGIARSIAVHNGVRVRFMRGDEILERYRASYDKETAVETEGAIDSELQRVPLLILDDLTTTAATDWATKKLLGLVNHRYQELKWTIVTANEVDLDSRTHRRLLDEESCEVVRLNADKAPA